MEDEVEVEVMKARRQFLKRAGQFAIYTPPAMIALMKPGYAAISNSVVGRPYTVPGQGVPPSGDPRR